MFAVGSLLVTLAFLGVLALFFYALLDEEYRRVAADLMPASHRVLWQNYKGYSVNWAAVKHVMMQAWHVVPLLVAAVVFAIRLLVLSLFAIRGPLPPRKKWWRVFYIAGGMALAALAAFMWIGLRNEWFGNLPVRQAGYFASTTFLMVPLWLAISSRIVPDAHDPTAD